MISLKIVLFVCVLGCTVSAMGGVLNAKTSAREAIRSEVSLYTPTDDLCTGVRCCTVGSGESCSLASMPKDQSTIVIPGGETRCIFSYSTPFAFQVIPGASDKLVYYFQGGGACWDAESTAGGFCTTDAVPQSLIGIYNRTNPDNKFKDYTIVQILYCSGDVHGGNVTRPYNDNNGVPVQQKGLANAQSVLDWTAKQQANGVLAATLSDLVLMGCSAGSLGAQLWGKQVLNTLKWSKAAVVPDSYAGIFPRGTTGPLIYGYNFCSSGFLSPVLYKKCMDQTISIPEMVYEFASDTPSVPYNFIQSKTDNVQMSFYMSIAASAGLPPIITPAQFYDDVNELFAFYTSHLPNFVTYLIDGYQHCFTCYDLYYTTDPVSAEDNAVSTNGTMLTDWTDNLPLSDGEVQDTVCEGRLKVHSITAAAITTSTASTADAVQGKNDYCSARVIPKQYVEKY